jgi:hypothetical protein
MFYIGVDLGQKQDYTAVAIVQREDELAANLAGAYNLRAGTPSRLLVRRVERIPLGTPYPRVVELIRETVWSRAMAGQCRLVVDSTGVGTPVVEMLRGAGMGCEITAVTITGGEKESGGGMNVGVPKRDLIAGLHLSLEKGELRIARKMKEAGTLVRELVAMKTNGAEGEEHDDLVIALALACWKARRRRIGYGESRIKGF